MAEDISGVSRELAEAMAAVQRDLARFGKVSAETADALTDAQMKAKFGVENFTKGVGKSVDAVGSLANAGMASAKALLSNQKGAAAMNGALTELSSAATAAGAALALLVPGGFIIKGLIAAVTLATTAFIEYAKQANEMSTKLYTGFQGMARAGAAAADGMTGLKDGAHKLGLGMNELSEYVSLVSENSRDLALMGGTVYKGRKQFEDLGKALEPAREGFYKMGLMPKDIAEGMAGYMRTQTRLGNAQRMTQDQLAAGAKAYLVEQDALTKLTGQTRKETEQAREAALMDQQFGAKIRELQLKGDEAGAKRLQDMFDMANAVTPELGRSIKALATGNLTNEDAQKLYQSTQGQGLRDLQEVIAGTKTVAQGMDSIAKSVGRTNDTLGVSYGQLGIANSFLMDFGASRKLQLAGEQGFEKQMEQIRQEQIKQGAKGGKAADAVLDAQARLITAQVEGAIAVEDFIGKGMVPATEAAIAMTRATTAAATGLNRLFGGADADKHVEMRKKAVADAKLTGMVSDTLTNDMGYDFGQLSGAEGGVFKGPSSGYPVLMHDEEIIVPMDKLTGAKKMSGIEGLLNAATQGGGLPAVKETEEFQVEMSDYVKRMLKDTATLTKITDTELKKTQNFNRINDQLIKLKTDLIKEEIELLEEQNKAIEDMANLMEKTGGADLAQAYRKSVIAARTASSGMGMPGMSSGGAPSGTGLQMPTSANMPSMGGGQGLQVNSQDDLKKMGLNIKAGDVQAEGAKISPKIIELARAIQAGVPGFSYFSSFNDKFHQEKAPTSKHASGLAVDFTVAQKPSVEDGAAITSWLKSMGASVAIDEYNSPTAKATGGHFHAQIPEFEQGGELGAGKLGIAGEAGPELITGPAGITPMNDLMGAFNNLGSLMKQQVDMLDELVRAQKTNNDISSKILRIQA